MAENTKRNVFGLHGVFGVLISIVGILVILVILMLMSIVVQRDAAKNPYDPSVIRDVNNLKMRSIDNWNYSFQAPKKDK
ncbi:MAG: DUF4006 domain-containing protein [Epsilonproteobacteria bacterium]|nr:MAG: DUF4006 domain-containing protein [Campylobacterota bacterium]